MNTTKLLCPECGKRIAGSGIYEYSSYRYQRDDGVIALSDAVYEIWLKDPYYQLICKNYHTSFYFKSKLHLTVDEFHAHMDTAEENYLNEVILPRFAPYKTGEVFVVIDTTAPPSKRTIYIDAESKTMAEGKAADLNEYMKKNPNRFTVATIKVPSAR